MSTNSYPRFLQDDLPARAAEACRFHIIPCPLERSVSYGDGTAAGPRAILEASRQLEAWLEDGIPGEAGIHTQEAIDCSPTDVQAILDGLGRQVTDTVAAGHIPITLGGEHAISSGPIKALHEAGHTFGVVQIDAHADLRDAYEGNPLSHASVMRRVTDLGIPLFQVGVRSLCVEEVEARKTYGVQHIDARELAIDGIPSTILPADFPENIYLTFDIDAFDASLMPATGTPEPGGLFWYNAVQILERVTAGRKVIAADLVELAPLENFHGATFTAAKLAYQIMRVAGVSS
jgi:agmatinase